MTRKTPAWLTSVALHAALALLVGLVWIVEAEEDCEIISCGGRVLPSPPDMDARRIAEEHPPIKPKVNLQPDPEIVNDAERVVVNTNPTNIDSSDVAGEHRDSESSKAFRGRMSNEVVGARGSAAARKGAFAARFG